MIISSAVVFAAAVAVAVVVVVVVVVCICGVCLLYTCLPDLCLDTEKHVRPVWRHCVDPGRQNLASSPGKFLTKTQIYSCFAATLSAQNLPRSGTVEQTYMPEKSKIVLLVHTLLRWAFLFKIWV